MLTFTHFKLIESNDDVFCAEINNSLLFVEAEYKGRFYATVRNTQTGKFTYEGWLQTKPSCISSIIKQILDRAIP